MNDCLQAYETKYFDTSNFQCFSAHVQGKTKRFKVRKRKYPSTEHVFLEIKSKTQQQESRKLRLEVDEFSNVLTDLESAWLNKNLAAASPLNLENKLLCKYQRLAFQHQHLPIRISLDFNLSFSNQNQEKNFFHSVILELKFDNTAQQEVNKITKAISGKNIAFSKYCIGAALLYEELKNTTFIQQIKQLNKWEASAN